MRFMAFEDGEPVDPMGLMVMHGRDGAVGTYYDRMKLEPTKGRHDGA